MELDPFDMDYHPKVNKIYTTKDSKIEQYLHEANELSKEFANFEIPYLPQENNFEADALATIAISDDNGPDPMIPSTIAMDRDQGRIWMGGYWQQYGWGYNLKAVTSSLLDRFSEDVRLCFDSINQRSNGE
ncbi:hypothetical protein QJS04_geneDACA021853 [Acorus gramineus]|uniref:RNase H type-1 domain-containing protein n=1 Tax=Acorus gramineus TaxID=55184 RepID=A0AAV9ATD1_ACOGR|nr:hypothetical protein QJS04_geneDACA021853 [Acorus gramineus]